MQFHTGDLLYSVRYGMRSQATLIISSTNMERMGQRASSTHRGSNEI